MKGNIFYAQSGGVTPVINATAFGLIEQFFKNKKYFVIDLPRYPITEPAKGKNIIAYSI